MARTCMGTDMKRSISWAALLVVGLSQMPAAEADRARPLFELACQYEASVEQFERIVLKLRGIDRADEQLVDRLDDRTARFRLAAKNPRHINRLLQEWRQVQELHSLVERAIFGKYTPTRELIYGWDVVRYQQALFADELFLEFENPNRGNSVRRVSASNSRRDQYLRTLAPPAR